jgi:uncharacterized Tic20 family protein
MLKYWYSIIMVSLVCLIWVALIHTGLDKLNKNGILLMSIASFAGLFGAAIGAWIVYDKKKEPEYIDYQRQMEEAVNSQYDL